MGLSRSALAQGYEAGPRHLKDPSMKPIFALLLIVAASAAQGAASAASGVEVLQPWSRPAVAGTNGVGYMILANHGPAPDSLEKVETPAAQRVEMHSSSMVAGVMSMKQEAQVVVPAGGRTIFGPGAYHLMLIGLNKPLRAGDHVPATLSFASGTKIKIAFTVSDGAGPPATSAFAR